MQTRVEEKKPSTARRMIVMIVGVLALIAIIAGFKFWSIMKMMAGFKPPPPAVVTTAKAVYQEWQPELRGIGTLRALRGADLALDIAGLVTAVNVKSGAEVRQGQLLLQLRDSEDVAQLRQLQAAEALAEVTFGRAQKEEVVQVISKADYDQAAADLKAKQAAVEQQKVNVAKKQLRAPFAGRAGIVTINPGTYLNAGTTIVTLQELDPIYVDFRMPQKNLAELKAGQTIALTLDAFPGKSFVGAISAISPKVDADTRNVQIEGKVPESGPRPDTGDVRQRERRLRRPAALSDPAADGRGLQPLRGDRLRRRDEGASGEGAGRRGGQERRGRAARSEGSQGGSQGGCQGAPAPAARRAGRAAAVRDPGPDPR